MDDAPEDQQYRLVLEKRAEHVHTREERVAFWFIAVCGVGTLIFGGLSYASAIKKPFLISYTGPRYMTSAEQEEERITRARITDTDTDGLSDYDELYIFSSSPYIADTDNDGRDDGVEVAEGGDPLCALGASCAQDEDLTVASTTDAMLDASLPALPEDAAMPTLEDTLGTLQSLTPQEIRTLFTEAGMDVAELSALSDAQIQELYTQALANAAQSLQPSSP